MPYPQEERRKVQRVTLARPHPARVGTARIFLVDASVDGLRIAHQGIVSSVGQSIKVEFEWEHEPINLECVVIHNTLFRLAKSKDEKSIYHAGLRIDSASAESRATLKKLVADVVSRALDEQIANARGIPAEAAQSFQTGKATAFIRYELIDGKWRRTSTTRPDQPENGFTVSEDEDRAQVEMLCQTFETSDAEGRKMIKTMAQMSISKAEGIPTRRYRP